MIPLSYLSRTMQGRSIDARRGEERDPLPASHFPLGGRSFSYQDSFVSRVLGEIWHPVRRRGAVVFTLVVMRAVTRISLHPLYLRGSHVTRLSAPSLSGANYIGFPIPLTPLCMEKTETGGRSLDTPSRNLYLV